MRENYRESLDRLGFTPEYIITEYLVPALNALETKFAQFKGEFTDEREVINWDARLRALDIALKIMGAYDGQRKPADAPTEITVSVLTYGQSIERPSDVIETPGQSYIRHPRTPPLLPPLRRRTRRWLIRCLCGCQGCEDKDADQHDEVCEKDSFHTRLPPRISSLTGRYNQSIREDVECRSHQSGMPMRLTSASNLGSPCRLSKYRRILRYVRKDACSWKAFSSHSNATSFSFRYA